MLLASGTGFAPMKAIVEHAVFKNLNRPMTLYWGARRKKDLYLLELAEQWASEMPNFKFVPVLSEPDASDAWTGRVGFVHRAVIEDLPDLSRVPGVRVRRTGDGRVGAARFHRSITACRKTSSTRTRSPARRIWRTRFDEVNGLIG